MLLEDKKGGDIQVLPNLPVFFLFFIWPENSFYYSKVLLECIYLGVGNEGWFQAFYPPSWQWINLLRLLLQGSHFGRMWVFFWFWGFFLQLRTAKVNFNRKQGSALKGAVVLGPGKWGERRVWELKGYEKEPETDLAHSLLCEGARRAAWDGREARLGLAR